MNQSDKLKEAAEARYPIKLQRVRRFFEGELTDVNMDTNEDDRNIWLAGAEYALSLSQSPVKSLEPCGYVFEGKFYETPPERTYSENSKPIPVYQSPVGEWVSALERLPECSETVLVSDIESDIVTTGWYNKVLGQWYCEVAGIDVTHWQPLPNPPRV